MDTLTDQTNALKRQMDNLSPAMREPLAKMTAAYIAANSTYTITETVGENGQPIYTHTFTSKE